MLEDRPMRNESSSQTFNLQENENTRERGVGDGKCKQAKWKRKMVGIYSYTFEFIENSIKSPSKKVNVVDGR